MASLSLSSLTLSSSFRKPKIPANFAQTPSNLSLLVSPPCKHTLSKIWRIVSSASMSSPEARTSPDDLVASILSKVDPFHCMHFYFYFFLLFFSFPLTYIDQNLSVLSLYQIFLGWIFLIIVPSDETVKGFPKPCCFDPVYLFKRRKSWDIRREIR